MTKQEALEIARGLVIAVNIGVYTREQAITKFRKIAAAYRQRDRFIEVQKSDEILWMSFFKILGQ